MEGNTKGEYEPCGGAERGQRRPNMIRIYMVYEKKVKELGLFSVVKRIKRAL